MANGIRGDFHANEIALRNMTSMQKRIEQAREAIPSGSKFRNYRDLGTSTPIATALNSDINKHENYKKSNVTSIMARMNEQDRTLGSIVKVAERFKAELVKFNSPGTSENKDAFIFTFKSLLSRVQADLNTSVNGKALFAGTATDAQAVDLSKIADGVPDTDYDTPNYSYYQGNDSSSTTFIKENEEFDYQMFANNPGFEKLIRAFKIATEPTITSGGDRVTKAQEVLDSSIKEISNLIASVGSKMKIVTDTNEDHENKQAYKEEKLRELLSQSPEEMIFGMMRDMHQLTMFNKLYAKSLGPEMSLSTYI